MHRFAWTGLLMALVVGGCGGKDDSANESDADTDADSDTDSDADSDADTDTDTDTDTDPDNFITGISTRIHDSIGSIVYVSWNQKDDANGYVRYSFDKDKWVETPHKDFAAGHNEQIVLGIPFGTSVEAEIVLDPKKGEQTRAVPTFSTEPLPKGLPLPTVVLADSATWEPQDNYLMGSINEDATGWGGGHYWKFIIDRQGRVVWAHETADSNWTIFMRVALDGTEILWEEQTYWAHWDEGAASRVHRSKIDLSDVEVYDTPGLHHCFTELPGDVLVWGAADGNFEELMQRDADGTVHELWNCQAFEKSIGRTDHCQSNSLWWDEKTDHFLYSFYTTSTVLEIDHSTGDTLHIWGDTLPGSWAFDPPSSVFNWEHGVTYTDAGTLLLSTKTPAVETEVREYTVDEKAQTLHNIWSFGAGEGIYASTAGEAHRLDNGNTLHNYGTGSRVREITHDKDLVWDVDWEGSRLLGRTVFLNDLYDFAP